MDADRARFFKLHSSLSKSDQDKILELFGCLTSYHDITVYQAVNFVLSSLKADRKKFGEIPWEFGSPKKREDDLVTFAKKYGFWRPEVKSYGKYNPETNNIIKF